MKVFGEEAAKAIPSLISLSERVQQVRASGLAPKTEDIKAWSEYREELTLVELRAAQLAKGLKTRHRHKPSSRFIAQDRRKKKAS